MSFISKRTRLEYLNFGSRSMIQFYTEHKKSITQCIDFGSRSMMQFDNRNRDIPISIWYILYMHKRCSLNVVLAKIFHIENRN